MALMPLPTDEVQRLIAVGAPTAIQYSTYWGRTAQEQYGRVLESAIVSFLGVSFSYFMSFVVGGFVATIFGSLFLFWGILSPELKAYQRNWEFLGGRELVDPWGVRESGRDPEDAGLYGALFLGYIADVCVVEDATTYSYEYDLAEFADYNMNDDELEKYTGRPYLLRLLVADKSVNGQDRDDIGGGRELQVHARLSDEYLDVRRGMPVSGILLSTSPRFDRLAAITDLFVPDAGCWIGDYPYLNRAEVEDLLARDDEIWDLLQLESNLEIDSYDNQGTSRTETGIATENAGRDSGYNAGIKKRFDVDDTFESFNAGSSWKNTEDGSSTWTSR
ncbi:predicted protein [Phaeodactylum tricornutum CCAP 1055/1]|jgi:hypothetical protein|uniref:Uncharacterized protein n=1 Tax=Phaeodactylum tricornutum (strain CCAP 1055/1) TaxID=556484 RepID=B7GBA4_PHATC|nr:predicted protein [Phaeodactylum tricornutum CCAP 1055/1]EEC44180.1 predicted protein [Phaeodactylum tricornutum CCAP 1055/1]|eukprot:XP_002184431.1 predicted protein [Phaeodactylum tricornutum CCAP 1055/1]